jgi:hypothetical protein
MAEFSNAYGAIWHSSRVRVRRDVGERLSMQEAAILFGAGALAAALVTWMPFPIRVPGYAILKAAVPIVFGVAAVPRPLAGSIAGLGGAALLSLCWATGTTHVPAAAATALLAIGPAIDLALLGISSARLSVFLRFAAAGLAANLLAFLVRWSTATLALDSMEPHRMARIGVVAFASFALCGICAGFVSAAIFFRGRSSQACDE